MIWLKCDHCISNLVNWVPQFVKWTKPWSQDFWRMRKLVENWNRFPGCAEYLNRLDIQFRYSPCNYEGSYCNHKKKYALNMQEICDHKRRFTDLAKGYPASVEDATGFNGTVFFKRPIFFSHPEEYILANKAYQVTRPSITSYKKPLASQERVWYREFNLYLAEICVRIE